jgi:hypothetical protein
MRRPSGGTASTPSFNLRIITMMHGSMGRATVSVAVHWPPTPARILMFKVHMPEGLAVFVPGMFTFRCMSTFTW